MVYKGLQGFKKIDQGGTNAHHLGHTERINKIESEIITTKSN
jgi:hypothetical protein